MKIDNLYAVAERLKGVTILNRPAEEVIKKLDSRQALFYLDPPYILESRKKSGAPAYKVEMSIEDHKELLRLASNLKGHVIISHYQHELYNQLLAGWHMVDTEIRVNGNSSAIETLFFKPETWEAIRKTQEEQESLTLF